MNHVISDALTATELTDSYTRGTLDPLEVIAKLRQRTLDTDEDLHAWVAVDWSGAERAAAQLRGGPSAEQPLWGVPIGIKDNIDLAGFPTRAGSRALDPAPVPEDAEVVASLRRAGAIPIGKLATTELATVSNPPRTTNPWNTDHTPGGSSSGPAAAVAAGMIPMALGTQTRGSVIRPASFTGTYGLSPTPGLVSTVGVVPNAYSIDRVGAFARSASDLALFLRAHSHRATPSRAPGDVVIGVVADSYFWDLTESACRAAVDFAAEKLREAGYGVRQVRLDLDFGELGSLHDLIEMTDFSAAHESLLGSDYGALGPYCVGLIRGASDVRAVDYVRAQEERRKYRARLASVIESLGVTALLTPAAPGAAPAGTTSTGSPKMSTPFTLLGFPAIAAPSVVDGNGLPVGVQLVVAPSHDFDLIDIAAAIEARARTVRLSA